jgi:hypothetical protein
VAQTAAGGVIMLLALQDLAKGADNFYVQTRLPLQPLTLHHIKRKVVTI